MPKVDVDRRRIVVRLLQEGWMLIRHGSDHDIYRHPDRRHLVAVPRHRTLTPGTARSIVRQAGWL